MKTNGEAIRNAWASTKLHLASNKVITGAFLAITAAISLFNISRAVDCGQDTGCVNPYWANFWLISYADGYERRAFLGQVLRFCFGDSISYFALNSIALVIVIGVLSFVYYLFFSRVSNNRNWLVVFVVLVSGPTSTVFFEVLCDPLHVALGCVIAYRLVADKLASASRSAIAALIAGLLVVLIHEASVFLYLPAIYLIHCLSARKNPKYGSLLLVMVLLTLGFAFFSNAQEPSSAGMALINKNSEKHFPPINTLPPLWDLLRSELLSYFKEPSRLIFKISGAFLWPLLLLLAVGHVLNSKACFRIFIYLLLPSLPLYFIAHDWGRFAIYTLCLSLVAYGRIPDDQAIGFPQFIERISSTAFRLTRPLLGSAASVIVLLLVFSSHPTYRIDGLSEQTVILTLAALAVFMLHHCLTRQGSDRPAPGTKKPPF